MERGTRSQQTGQIVVARLFEQRPIGPNSTTLPAYITAKRSAVRAQQSQFVGDHDHGDPQLTNQPDQLRSHPDPHDRVERRGRLVGDEQFRLGEDGGDTTARCSIPPESWWGYRGSDLVRAADPQAPQHLDRPPRRLTSAHPAVELQAPADLRPHPPQGVEGGERVLGDEPDPAPSELLGAVHPCGDHDLTVESDLTPDHLPTRSEQPQDRQPERGLA